MILIASRPGALHNSGQLISNCCRDADLFLDWDSDAT